MPLSALPRRDYGADEIQSAAETAALLGGDGVLEELGAVGGAGADVDQEQPWGLVPAISPRFHCGYYKLRLLWQSTVALKSDPVALRGIGYQLKTLAKGYGIDPKVVYPHSFRHRFAKNFLAKFNDIAPLADLMGHESIETTRIYLRRTATEQRELIDRIVTW